MTREQRREVLGILAFVLVLAAIIAICAAYGVDQ